MVKRTTSPGSTFHFLIDITSLWISLSNQHHVSLISLSNRHHISLISLSNRHLFSTVRNSEVSSKLPLITDLLNGWKNAQSYRLKAPWLQGKGEIDAAKLLKCKNMAKFMHSASSSSSATSHSITKDGSRLPWLWKIKTTEEEERHPSAPGLYLHPFAHRNYISLQWLELPRLDWIPESYITALTPLWLMLRSRRIFRVNR